MKKGMVVATVVVGVLGLITVILGIAGAASSGRACESEDGATPGVGCGVVASLLALATQIVASAATGCCGCCRTWSIPSEAKRIVAIVLSTFSWFLAIIAVILFMVAAILSTSTDVSTGGKCVSDGTGPFVAATILFIITVVFQVVSYILLQATTAASSTKPLGQESGIAMGNPVNQNAAETTAASSTEQNAAETTAASSTEQNAAASGDPPPSAPPASSDQITSPTPTVLTNKANADPANQV
ncbi:hypothetical protein BRADI_3g21250v3 [Brachypodium distachyon]|uniref:Uncharacterized protein n=2 Tax=Brachypodium distachyon TaxID=15368 RepID=A0A0Q3FD63_BRADI|nr:hypothetical protein BRADI_3g21250v3 [Brachypodium distachyon]